MADRTVDAVADASANVRVQPLHAPGPMRLPDVEIEVANIDAYGFGETSQIVRDIADLLYLRHDRVVLGVGWVIVALGGLVGMSARVFVGDVLVGLEHLFQECRECTDQEWKGGDRIDARACITQLKTVLRSVELLVVGQSKCEPIVHFSLINPFARPQRPPRRAPCRQS
ncbi:hypothetical protein FJ548_24405 [Mesorhizobium sp. B2-4-17]|nr:hypothetical protein FJ548_24405 [Mesorhizobium sp. B2-4-17]